MATVIHTGRLYGGENITFSPGEAIKEASELELKLTDYVERVKQQREKELLSLMDVNTDNLLLEQYQTEAQKLVDGYVNEAKDIWKGRNGILSAEDKLSLLKKKNELTSRLGTFQAKAEAYLLVKDEYLQRKYLYDHDETVESINRFLKDPINNDVPTLVPAYKNPDVLSVEYLNKVHPWSAQSYEREIGGRRVYSQFRDNIESEEQGKNVLVEIYNSNDEVKRSVIKEMETKGIKDKSPEQYFAETRLYLTLPREVFKPAPTPSGLGGSSRGKVPISFANNSLNFSGKEQITTNEGKAALVNGMAVVDNQVVVSMYAADPNTQIPLSFDKEEDAKMALAAMPNFTITQGTDGKFYLAKKSYYPIGKDMTEVNEILSSFESRYRNNKDVMSDIAKFKSLLTRVKETPTKQKKVSGIVWKTS